MTKITKLAVLPLLLGLSFSSVAFSETCPQINNLNWSQGRWSSDDGAWVATGPYGTIAGFTFTTIRYVSGSWYSDSCNYYLSDSQQINMNRPPQTYRKTRMTGPNWYPMPNNPGYYECNTSIDSCTFEYLNGE